MVRKKGGKGKGQPQGPGGDSGEPQPGTSSQSSTVVSQEHTPSPVSETPEQPQQQDQAKKKRQKVRDSQQQGPQQPQQQQSGPQHVQQQPRGPQPVQQQESPQQRQERAGPPPGFQQPAQQWTRQQQQPRGPQQQQQRGPQQQQQRFPQQQQQRGSPQQMAPQQFGPPPQRMQSPPGMMPPRGTPPQQQQQQQQQQRGPQQQQQQRGPQQQQQQQSPRQKPPQQQPGPSRPQAAPSGAKELSPPPFGGQGDYLRSMALVKPGTQGRKILVESNHLSLNVGKLMDAVHYDVTITPDTPKALLRDVMIVFGRKHYPHRNPAFDGRKNLYSPIKLPLGDNDTITDSVTVDGENNRAKEFKVEIKFARMVDLSPLHDMLRTKTSPQDALQCLDIVLRNASANTCISAGRCFFTPPTDQIIELGDGMEMYYGFYQSAIRGWKPLLNLDVSHKAFPKAQNLLQLTCELGSDFRYTMTMDNLARGDLAPQLREKLEKFIRTLKIKYEITNQSSSKRIYRVNGLGEAPNRARFRLEDGRDSTVENYFRSVKRAPLRFPHLPTVWVGSRERESKILLPMEFCSLVEGQVVNRKMTENQTSAMIKKAATSTQERKTKIMKSYNTANFNADPCVREFGFSVSDQFEKLDARVLQPPSLMYANEQVVTPSRGVWKSDRNRFLKGATIQKWTIAFVTRSPCRADQLADMIHKFAATSGMQMVSKATQPFVHVGPRQSLPDIIGYFRTKQDYDLIFVVVPNAGPQYSFVKKAAELNVGCLTQCIKERTLNRLNPQTVVNILLKVNSKMNGTNHTLNKGCRPVILLRPCMIMGADVTHPSPDARDIPSVAAVTASHDPNAFQYNICWRLQPPKVEIIEDLCNITMEQLNFFHKRTGCKPETIVFFRDGVSEGQFREVQQAEIRAIQKACKQLQSDGYEPKITFLVVQKRHHTRLFPTNPRDSEDRNMNVPAGTCVDTQITNPTMQDFYLVSHASIQGVAKPTKYCTLWDDNNLSNDEVEQLTYHLCHMFTRCNRSVSYPAPTYYAHLAAARAKVYIENDRLNMDNLKQHQNSYQIQEKICKGKPMFFV